MRRGGRWRQGGRLKKKKKNIKKNITMKKKNIKMKKKKNNKKKCWDEIDCGLKCVGSRNGCDPG